jgi:putative membrane protein
MFLEILLFFALGIVLGVLAGLVPGLHPNTLLVTLLSFSLLLEGNPVYWTLALITSLAVSNTIVNFIPSIFIGAPDPDTCLSVLPGHRLLARGEGYDALFLTVVGGVSVMIITVLALPFLLWFIPSVYGIVHAYIHWLLLLVFLALLFQEKGKKKLHALFFFLTSGAAGFMLLSSLPSRYVLFPSLTGLFGLSIIITGMAHSVSLPEQKSRRVPRHGFVKGGIAGWLAGMFVGVLPGIGSAQAGVLANTVLKGNEKDFLVALGGINTANIMFTFIALHTISKARSGAAAAVSEIAASIGIGELYFMTIIALLSCFTASVLTLWLGKRSASLMTEVSYKKLNAVVLLIIIVLVLAFSGVQGLLIAALCTIIGVACALIGIKRMYLMGFLMVPTILFFSGMAPYLSVFLGF